MRQNEREREGRDTQGRTKDRRITEREKERQREREKKVREREGRREGERARKNMLGTYYATKCTRLCMNKTPHLKTVHVYVNVYLIKPYQPFNQTRTSTTHNQTIFSPSLRIYSHISHSSQSYGQQ